MKKTNWFYRFVAITLVFITCLFGFFATGTKTMALRDYDAAIGLLKRPDKTASSLAKFFKPIEANAQLVVIDPSLILKYTIEAALNAALRAIVLGFVKSLLNFLKDQFDSLLRSVEQWANALLGLQINFSSIRNFVALQTVRLYNQIEGSTNAFFDGLFGPVLTDAQIRALSSSVTTGEMAAANRAAIEANPGSTNDGSPPPSSDIIKGQIVNTVGDMLKQIGCGTTISFQDGGNNTTIAAAAAGAAPIFGDQDFGCANKLTVVTSEIDRRFEAVAGKTKEAAKPEYVKNGTDACAQYLVDKDELYKQAKLTAPAESKFADYTKGGVSSDVAQKALDNPTSGTISFGSNDALDAIYNTTKNVTIGNVTQEQCKLAYSKTDLLRDQLKDATKGSGGLSLEQELANTFTQFINDLVTSIFNAITEIITKIITAAFNAVINLINKIGIREISGPLAEAASKIKNATNQYVRTILDGAAKSLQSPLPNK